MSGAKVAVWIVLSMLLAATVSVWATVLYMQPDSDQAKAVAIPIVVGPSHRIAYIPKNAGNPYFTPIYEGMKMACMQSDSEVTMIAPDKPDPTSQIPLIKEQIQQHVDVIVITPNSPDALVPALDEARERGIIVITVDSDLTGNEKARVASVQSVEPKVVGASQIELMGSLIGYKGKFAILSATPDAPNQSAWIKAMKETLASDARYKELELVDTVYGNDDPKKSLAECEALIAKHPDLNGILSPTTVGIAAAAQCVQSAGKAAQIKVTGLGSPNEMRPYIKNGTVEAFALWSPYEQGFLTGVLAQQLASKSLNPEPGGTFSGQSVGDRKFDEHKIVYAGAMLTFTKHNIDQFNF